MQNGYLGHKGREEKERKLVGNCGGILLEVKSGMEGSISLLEANGAGSPVSFQGWEDREEDMKEE